MTSFTGEMSTVSYCNALLRHSVTGRNVALCGTRFFIDFIGRFDVPKVLHVLDEYKID